MKNKKTLLIFGVVFLVLVVLGYFRTGVNSSSSDGISGPKAVFEPKVYDFGDVEFGQIAKYEFTLGNEGDQVLEINRVSTSCGCTKAKISQESLAPGEKTKVLVSFNPEAMGKTIIGKSVQRFIYIRSNDSANPQVEATIHARVK